MQNSDHGGPHMTRVMIIFGIFVNPPIPNIENWSPDMIPVAFDGKFDELLNEIPPGIYRLHIVEIFQYWGWED